MPRGGAVEAAVAEENSMATIRYHVEMADDRGGFRSAALAESAGGTVRSTVPRFDGSHDLALIDVGEGAGCEALEELLDGDDNVLTYRHGTRPE